MVTTMSALRVDDRLRHADGDGLVVCATLAAIGVRRRYDAADGNINGLVGEVRWMIAVMMATTMSVLMGMEMSICCLRQW